ncbi:MAG: hypothetical protein JW819_06355 [Candidatus Krumholzibacteriota bacterium]|jgi:hypothetical protein|nr:hypothetical protein [Candidatus Krumholzibacteriota bacterium]
MKSEMDAMGMDERQRQAWYRANRAVLMLVGVLWIGLIVRGLLAGGRPWFLIAMVPVLALVRLACYRWYLNRP